MVSREKLMPPLLDFKNHMRSTGTHTLVKTIEPTVIWDNCMQLCEIQYLVVGRIFVFSSYLFACGWEYGTEVHIGGDPDRQ